LVGLVTVSCKKHLANGCRSDSKKDGGAIMQKNLTKTQKAICNLLELYGRLLLRAITIGDV